MTSSYNSGNISSAEPKEENSKKKNQSAEQEDTKTILKDIQEDVFLTRLMKFDPYTYSFIKNSSNNAKFKGFKKFQMSMKFMIADKVFSKKSRKNNKAFKLATNLLSFNIFQTNQNNGPMYKQESVLRFVKLVNQYKQNNITLDQLI